MDLELLVITFNRAAELDRTLARLHDSPFAGCRVSVLDNASTDDTPAVCARWAERFDDLRVVRHRLNVGGGPNYLRAIELSRAAYTWVLADDDDFDFSDTADVIAAIDEGEVDLIAAGSPGREDWQPGRTTLRRLHAEGERVFTVLTFVPGIIFRTATFTDQDMADGYRAVDDLYPPFPWLRRMFAADASILVPRAQLVRRVGATTPGSHLYFLTRWVRNCRPLPGRVLRRQVIYRLEPSPLAWFGVLVAAAAIEKAEFPERVWPELRELLGSVEREQRLLVALAAIPALLPGALLRRLRRVLRPGSVEGDTFHDLADRP